jgi:C-terminal processing protease CtpA/Prc
MIRRSFGYLAIIACVCTYALGQGAQTKKDQAPATRAFAFSFGDDGGYLGVETVDVNRENAGKFGLSSVRGVAVQQVMDNSPAKAAGIQAGDVITSFNGEEISSVRKLSRLIGEIAPDHQARLTVSRGGAEREVTVTLGKRPAPRFESGNFEFATPGPGQMTLPDMPDIPMPPQAGALPRVRIAPGADSDMFVFRASSSRQIGISVSALSKQLAEYFGATEGGLLISSVRENSPAARAGLKAGDVITEVDGKALAGDFDLIRAISEKKDGDIELTVIRDHSRQSFRVTPEAMKSEMGPAFEKSDFEVPQVPMLMKRPADVSPVTTPAPLVFGRPGSRVL